MTKPVDPNEFIATIQKFEDFWLEVVRLPQPRIAMSDTTLDVLLIEDNPGDARLVEEMLYGVGDQLERIDLDGTTLIGHQSTTRRPSKRG